MKEEDFVGRLGQEKASAILRTDDAEKAFQAMEAVVRGGFKVVEFTLTTPGALELITEFSRREGLLVGAGTVLDRKQARRAVEAGACFLVSPVTDEDLIRETAALGAAWMPGTHTPTEMLLAHRAGAPLCKLFPAPAGGPAWVRSVLAPLPFLRIVPTNGVDEHNAVDWLAAGAWAVGFVAPLFRTEDIAAARWDVLEERARRCLAAAAACGG